MPISEVLPDCGTPAEEVAPASAEADAAAALIDDVSRTGEWVGSNILAAVQER